MPQRSPIQIERGKEKGMKCMESNSPLKENTETGREKFKKKIEGENLSF
jgi:hypothetical protein